MVIENIHPAPQAHYESFQYHHQMDQLWEAMNKALKHGPDYSKDKQAWEEKLSVMNSIYTLLSDEEKMRLHYSLGRFVYGNNYENALAQFVQVLRPESQNWQDALKDVANNGTAKRTEVEAMALFWALNSLINVPGLEKSSWIEAHRKLYEECSQLFDELELPKEKGNLIYNQFAFQNDDPDALLEALKEAERLNPDLALQCLNRRSMILTVRGDYNDALELVKEAIDKVPANYNTFLLANFRNRYVGLGCRCKKSYEELKAVMQLVLAEAETSKFDHSYHAAYLFQAAKLEIYGGHLQEAAAYLKQGLELAHEHPDIHAEMESTLNLILASGAPTAIKK